MKRRPASTPCTWNGIEYPSVNHAAKALGVSWQTMYDRLRCGYTSDDDMFKRHRTPCTWNGIEYPTIDAAAKANHISRAGMWYRVAKGYTSDDDLYAKAAVIEDDAKTTCF